MNLITVIPLTKSKVASELSYFTASPVPLGAIVTVPLRSKMIHAIVSDVTPAEQSKSSIKRASFQIKKLGKVKAISFFPAPYIEASRKLANYYATNVGSIITALISQTLLENAHRIPAPMTPNSPSLTEIYAVQGDNDDRSSAWRSLIRQEFARKKSLVIYAPTREEIKNIAATLSKGVEDYVFVLHGGLTPKKIIETWGKIADTAHPILIIATSSFSVLPRTDIDSVIIERENSRGWIGQAAPYIDTRQAIETIARAQKQTIYIADNLLRVETLHRVEEHEISEGSPFKWKSISTAQDILVDMRVQTQNSKASLIDGKGRARLPSEKFRAVSPELEACITMNREDNSHLFIMAARRGLASITVCDDCETVVSCKECSSPVVLHASKETGKNFFMCHSCGARRNAVETCVNCAGWRLTPLGIGTERVAEEIRAKFPSVDIFSIDADAGASEKQIQITLQKFRAKPGSILIGTERALLHLGEPVEHAAIASLDSLFAIPDFRIQERIMYNIIRLRSLAKRSFIVQTRKAEETVFEYGLKGNLGDFYRAVLHERKQFLYPPFSTLIKVTIEGKKDEIASQMAAIKILVAPQVIDVFPAFTSSSRGNSVIHGLMKCETRAWPHKELATKLREMPPSVKVKINPESLL